MSEYKHGIKVFEVTNNDLIARVKEQQKTIRELVEALRPFNDVNYDLSDTEDWPDTWVVSHIGGMAITMGIIRNAVELVAKHGDK